MDGTDGWTDKIAQVITVTFVARVNKSLDYAYTSKRSHAHMPFVGWQWSVQISINNPAPSPATLPHASMHKRLVVENFKGFNLSRLVLFNSHYNNYYGIINEQLIIIFK